jgi:hypothetical protein
LPCQLISVTRSEAAGSPEAGGPVRGKSHPEQYPQRRLKVNMKLCPRWSTSFRNLSSLPIRALVLYTILLTYRPILNASPISLNRIRFPLSVNSGFLVRKICNKFLNTIFFLFFIDDGSLSQKVSILPS